MVLVWLQRPTENCSIAVIWLIINFLFSPQIEEGRPLPSPSHLKRKIIIKNKKLKPEQEMEGEKIILFSYISYWGEKNYFHLYFDKYKYVNLFFSRPSIELLNFFFISSFHWSTASLAWEKKKYNGARLQSNCLLIIMSNVESGLIFPFRFQWIA